MAPGNAGKRFLIAPINLSQDPKFSIQELVGNPKVRGKSPQLRVGSQLYNLNYLHGGVTFIPTWNANSQTPPELSLQDTAPFPRSLQSCSKPQEFLHHQIQALFPLLLPLQGILGLITSRSAGVMS